MSECERCESLRAELAAARAGRDDALLELAREREKVNALRLSFPKLESEPPTLYPGDVGPGAPPMRYVMVDAANDALKLYLGPLQRIAKRLLGRSA